ncbi:hypothetical protein [Sphingobacterium athyrii]|uniref:Uncharacterized protein n=1 Tax=Sphingobacterium athyrii TaxID=2152717 RepID=A0A363NP55_9SPHI|nr:hypothetical protein [Sphingobacterium athyrii]PUV22543.1 hypothetical protein DCO56_20250 [Sphingobacterium athyrii]
MCLFFDFFVSHFTGFATIIAACIAGCIAYNYQKGNLDISHEKMEKELFTEFNGRYDMLNDKLSELDTNLNLKNLNKDLEKIVIDYFNLCAEQYYWYNKKRISEEIWNSWHSGMMYYYQKYPVVQELWEKETEGEKYKSYYLEKKQGFFEN